MRAMVLSRPGELLRLRDLPYPVPGAGEIRVRVAACGICRNDLHVVDGELGDLREGRLQGAAVLVPRFTYGFPRWGKVNYGISLKQLI